MTSQTAFERIISKLVQTYLLNQLQIKSLNIEFSPPQMMTINIEYSVNTDVEENVINGLGIKQANMLENNLEPFFPYLILWNSYYKNEILKIEIIISDTIIEELERVSVEISSSKDLARLRLAEDISTELAGLILKMMNTYL